MMTSEEKTKERVELNMRMKHGEALYSDFVRLSREGVAKERLAVMLGVSAARVHKIIKDLGLWDDWKKARGIK